VAKFQWDTLRKCCTQITLLATKTIIISLVKNILAVCWCRHTDWYYVESGL